MVIIVSGNPATGKTTIAKKIAKEKKLEYIDVNDLIKKNRLYSYYSKKDESLVVDTKKLNSFLIKLINKNKDVVLDSHLTHYLNPKYVDMCIITICDLKELKKRLEKRKYSKEKIRNNLDCEIFDVCRTEALEAGHKVKIIKTSK
ncbi:AAA family ATPase [Candidatus Woesearchaeota archaeon]|nr:AAA family ATPase [Candidatus Woesearchaeota archaeon]